MYTVDSTIDVALQDSKLRAADYFTPEYAAQLRTEHREYVPELWRRHRAYLAVRLRPLAREAGAPKDAPTVAHRQ
ncbi:hypothetical protein ACFQ07_31545, partial [Actinomadura adrarensis]